MRKKRRKWGGKPAGMECKVTNAMVDAWSGRYGYESRKKESRLGVGGGTLDGGYCIL